MKLIFATLILVNLGIAAWGLFLRDSSAGALQAESQSGQMQSNSSSGDAKKANSAHELCELVGPFPADDGAKSFVERLAAIDIKGEIKNLDLPAGKSYWVYLQPLDTEDAAFRKLAELQSQGVESYIVRRGDLKNAISLGMYSYKDTANSRVAEMKKKGLDPVMQEIERTQHETWVMLRHDQVEKMSDLTWKKVLEGFDSQERRQNFCIDVASADNIH